MNTIHGGWTMAAMAAACMMLVSPDVSAFSGGGSAITGRTNRDGGAGCSSCHSNQAQNTSTMTVGISGPSTLAPGASGTYTVTANLSINGTSRRMGLAVAASAGTLTENAANLQVSNGEITHAGTLETIDDTGGQGSYSFTYTNPANATGGSSRTLYAVARIGFDNADGGAWRHAANFTVTTSAPAQVALTVSKTGNGAGTVTSIPTGINCGSDCSENYDVGTPVTLTASPSAGSTFTGWTGSCLGIGTCSLTMSVARSLTANFMLSAAQQFSLSVTKTGTGTGTVTSTPSGISCGSDCNENYDSGTSVTLTAAPTAGSTFTGWSGACTGTGSCTVSMTEARSVTAAFASTTGGTVTFQGLWWNSPEGSENGWGVNLTHQGDILFGTWFTYDTDGSGMWLVMPSGNKTGSTDSFSGALFRTTGPPFNAVPFNPNDNQIGLTQVGTATFNFSSSNAGTFIYTVNGITQSKPITRQIFSSPAPSCTAGGAAPTTPNYQDLWWRSPAGSENGWGVNLTHQGDILFATWFTYAADGRGQWLVVSNGARTSPTSNSYTGDLLRTRGPAFNSVPWNSGAFTFSVVGTATFTFTDANNGTFSYTLDGISQTKAITRQVYSSPASVCRTQ
jgi:hypothetical protein